MIFVNRALESLINFAYSGMVKIDNQNVQSLMVGSAFLQLNKVRDACADFLISRYTNLAVETMILKKKKNRVISDLTLTMSWVFVNLPTRWDARSSLTPLSCTFSTISAK